MDHRELHAAVHCENGSYWAEALELPGCFASGDSAAELIESMEEAVAMYLAPPEGDPNEVEIGLAGFDLSLATDQPLQLCSSGPAPRMPRPQ